MTPGAVVQPQRGGQIQDSSSHDAQGKLGCSAGWQAQVDGPHHGSQKAMMTAGVREAS